MSNGTRQTPQYRIRHLPQLHQLPRIILSLVLRGTCRIRY